jgi:lysophospholipase L1-like esterase
LELKLGNVDHWCLDGSDKHCPHCDDPTDAISRHELKWWREAFTLNVARSRSYMQSHETIDVIFLGDSNTEALAGTYKGQDGSDDGQEREGHLKRGMLEDYLVRSKKKFEKYFDKSSGNGALYNGLALGISGDSSPNLLWRIQNNEMSDLVPRVWWITIGANDMVDSNCSEEIAIMGVLRVVEELLNKMDGATIVINSILPVATRSSLSLEGPHIQNKYWAAIKFVNERLAKFAKKHQGVKFFDATEMLTEFRVHNRYMKNDYFRDLSHLSVDGQDALVKAQADFLTSLFESQNARQDPPLDSIEDDGNSTAYFDDFFF